MSVHLLARAYGRPPSAWFGFEGDAAIGFDLTVLEIGTQEEQLAKRRSVAKAAAFRGRR